MNFVRNKLLIKQNLFVFELRERMMCKNIFSIICRDYLKKFIIGCRVNLLYGIINFIGIVNKCIKDYLMYFNIFRY